MTPIVARRKTTIAVPRDELFDRWVTIDLEDVMEAYGPLPGVEATSDRTGPWREVGTERTVHLTDGGTLHEEVVVSEPPERFAYRVFGFDAVLGLFVEEARGCWDFEEADGGTKVHWEFRFWPTSYAALPILVPLVRLLWSRQMERALEATRGLGEREAR